ncbi:hypothetical protein GCM10010433_50520 [Streptomyces pulveraceus]|uniref:Uncharacterized protein n=1 Tax=Streptomyces pulveraceus TaxID=68258 RepID=A0ABW1GKH0_9ACTN
MIWLGTALYGYERDEHGAFVRACARGKSPRGIAPQVAALLTRHGPLAAVMTDYYREFRFESRQTSYPLEAIRRIGGLDDASVV